MSERLGTERERESQPPLLLTIIPLLLLPLLLLLLLAVCITPRALLAHNRKTCDPIAPDFLETSSQTCADWKFAIGCAVCLGYAYTQRHLAHSVSAS